MQLDGVTYTGPEFSDSELLKDLPPQLAAVLVLDNGFVAARGGFHMRGACREPLWHSLRAAWTGPESVRSRYPDVRETDIPFAEDALGDQFLLRDGNVYRLAAETGEIESVEATLEEFLARVANDAFEYLNLQPLLNFEQRGGRLAPGELLNVYPPYCVKSEKERSYCAISADQHLRFLARLAAEIRHLPDGAAVDIKITP
jgi:hypothetical protein